MLLQNKLADTSMAFKDVLEVRTQVCSEYPMSRLRDMSDIYRLEHERIEGSNRAVHVLRSGGCGKSSAIKSV
jgi:hypothetical protein